MNEPEAYIMANLMILESVKYSGYYFPLTSNGYDSFIKDFVTLLKKQSSKHFAKIRDLKVPLNQLVETWFNRLFVGYLPFRVNINFFFSKDNLQSSIF
jgi:hypothetical protein